MDCARKHSDLINSWLHGVGQKLGRSMFQETNIIRRRTSTHDRRNQGTENYEERDEIVDGIKVAFACMRVYIT
jgi:hypothetical protein